MGKLVRVLIADDNRNLIQVLKTYIQSQEDMELVGAAYNGNEALDLIYQLQPDVIILDMVMPYLDGLGVLEKLRNEKRQYHVIIISALKQESIVQRVVSLGADFYILKPLDLQILAKRIRQLFGESNLNDSAGQGVKNLNSYIANGIDGSYDKNMLLEVTRMLQQMGIPAHVKGYQYLREAIVSVLLEVSLLNAATGELYPMIAEKYNTTPSRVERGIRHAIELAWGRGKEEFINKFFNFDVCVDRAKPTNLEFIALLAERLRLPNLM